MIHKISFYMLSILLISSFCSVLWSGSDQDVGTVTFSKKLRLDEQIIEPGTYTIRIREAGQDRRILLVQDNAVKVDALAIQIPLDKPVADPVIVVERMRSDNLLRLKVKVGKVMLLAFYKII